MSGDEPERPGAEAAGSAGAGRTDGEVVRLAFARPPAAGQAATRPGGGMGGADPGWRLHLGLHPDVTSAQLRDGALSLTLVQGLKAEIPWRDPALGRALAALARGGAPWSRFAALCAGEAEPGAPPTAGRSGAGETPEAAARRLGAEAWTALLHLSRSRLLAWWYGAPDLRAVEILPLSGRYAPLSTVPATPDLRIAEGAVLAWATSGLLLEVPDIDAVVTVTPAGLPLVGAIMGAGRPGAPPLPAAARAAFAAAGILRPPPDPAAPDPPAADWTTWDRLAHRLTRDVTRMHAPIPGLPERDRDDSFAGPPPAWARPGLPRIALPRPAPDLPSRPLAEVLERRRSRREPGARPLTLAALGALLWRVARRRDDRRDELPGAVLRNLPGGGAKGDVSLYVAVGRCLGLPRGFYGYDDVAHALTRFPDAGRSAIGEGPAGRDAGPGEADPLAAVLAQAEGAMSAGAPPDAVVVMGWRPGALARRYYSNAYRLGLMHAGVHALGLALAAEDLGLAGCPLGLGEHRHFARLTGVDPLVETALAEFALSGRDDAAEAAGPAEPPGA
ncbi:SagB/ThcOx family dehydrogenase [Albimonas sp. CAU 1670]|uniref:SagB/ThcOx family dehydrogenase n=1 Tax=Albimonas sp. CAU 1670 TaxID=3032599 RepID=UPI0023D9E2FB|nr:SagB/ThcOx family dehydrogenase [Albimonas sp. CAU 1670]MDF2234787.1 SagB/ThcOx family dehydrogenase [Albimonas sp. CAU 1670]